MEYPHWPRKWACYTAAAGRKRWPGSEVFCWGEHRRSDGLGVVQLCEWLSGAVSAQAGIMVLIGIALYALTGVPPS
jgi:hypothetical protein